MEIEDRKEDEHHGYIHVVTVDCSNLNKLTTEV